MAIKDTSFINGIVKSREKYLITGEKFARMADSVSADEAFSLLRENGFGGEGEFCCADYEKLINGERQKLENFIREYCPEKRFADCVFSENDFFNAECALRLHYGAGDKAMYKTEGNVLLSELTAYVKGEKSSVPSHISKAIDEAKKLFDENAATGFKVGMIFLRAYYAYALKTAVKGAQKDGVVYEIDCKNISTAVRQIGRESGKNTDNGYIDGGKIDLRDLEVITSGDENAVLKKFSSSEYLPLIKLALKEKLSGKPLVEFERECESFTLKKLKERRFETEGLFPLLLYYNYKINELKNVRIVIVGKISGADKDVIRTRLRECYAG